MTGEKPLGIKAYGSIPHLIGSRMGPGDKHVDPGMARIATERARDKYDSVLVQEKLDGSCTAVVKVDGRVLALGRSGYLARTSPYEQHHLFDDWVSERIAVFNALLRDGERIVGEWLAQAHGTRYDLTDRQPWVAFDIIAGPNEPNGYVPRLSADEVRERTGDFGLAAARAIVRGPTSIEDAMLALGTYGHYGALDPIEGAVWRIERQLPNKALRVDLVKYVRPDKVDGLYLPESERATVTEPVWNYTRFGPNY